MKSCQDYDPECAQQKTDKLNATRIGLHTDHPRVHQEPRKNDHMLQALLKDVSSSNLHCHTQPWLIMSDKRAVLTDTQSLLTSKHEVKILSQFVCNSPSSEHIRISTREKPRSTDQHETNDAVSIEQNAAGANKCPQATWPTMTAVCLTGSAS